MRTLSLIAALVAVSTITTAFVLVETSADAKPTVIRSTLTPSATTTTTMPAPSPAPDPTAVAQQVQQAVQAVVPGATVGLLVVDRDTGNTVASIDADRQFYSASVVKLLIALDVINSAGGSLDQDTQDSLHQMLAFSDDNVADDLWDENGGGSIVTNMAGALGLSGTTAPDDPTQWGETLLTARDVTTIYHYITTTLAGPGRDVILNTLGQAGQTAADGFDQYFGIPDGLPGTTWAIKQGWMALDNSIVLNTTGLVGPSLRYEVVLLTSLPANTSWATGEKALTSGAGALSNVIPRG